MRSSVVVDVYEFYLAELISNLKNKKLSHQLQILEDVHIVPTIFDFCGITKRLDYVGDVFIVYDHVKCHQELLEVTETEEVSIFLLDRILNTRCSSGKSETCCCVLCKVNNRRVLVHYF